MDPESLNPTRQSLVSRLKQWDDQEGWQEFFDTYWRLFYSVARKSGLSDEEAQEVVQATVIAVAKSIHEFKRDPAKGSFKGWLLQIARWRIADQRRKQHRKDRHTKEPLDETDGTPWVERIADPAGPGLEAVWDEEWERNLLAAATDKVKRRVRLEQYQMFDLHVLKEWPAERVAERFGVTANQVYAAKYKVSRMIEKELGLLRTKEN